MAPEGDVGYTSHSETGVCLWRHPCHHKPGTVSYYQAMYPTIGREIDSGFRERISASSHVRGRGTGDLYATQRLVEYTILTRIVIASRGC